MIQDLLQRLRDDGVRRDFLSGRKGACKIEKADLEFIDKFTKQVTPVRPEFSNESPFLNSAKTSAEQWSFLIDGRSNRQFAETSLTYEKGKDLFNRIQNCGYWEKDVKVVEVIEESRAQNDTPSTEDLEIKEEKSGSVGEKAMPVSAPTAAQVPTPTFNDNVNMQQQQQMQQQQMHHAPMARHPNQQPQVPSNGPVNAKVVEGTYYNQMKYSQGNGMPVSNEFATAGNFSFLQESELDTPAAPGSQQKMPINVMQPINVKHSPVQPSIPTQVYKNAGFYAQSPIAAGQMFPPGLKVQQQQQHNLQNAVPHIPVNYQPSPQQLNQQAAVISQVPTNMIPKQQQQANGNQVGSGFIAQSQTPPVQQQQPSSRPYHPPTMVPTTQYQQQNQVPNAQNLQNVLESKPAAKPKVESTEVKTNGDGRRGHDKKEKRDNYQQEPQIDTWTNETAAQPSTTGTTRQGSGFNRNNRSSGPREGNAREREGGQGAPREGNQRDGPREGGAKYNNYR